MSNTNAMEFVETPIKMPRVNKHVATKLTRKMALEAVEPLGTPTIMWMLVKRHRVGLLANAFIIENALLVAKIFNVI